MLDQLMDLFYDPNLKRAVEEDFMLAVTKFRVPGLKIFSQYEFETSRGDFTVDFVIIVDDRHKVVVELTPKHVEDPMQIEWKDAILLGETEVQHIVRIDEDDMKFNPDDTLFLLSQWYPNIFQHKAVVNLEHLASDFCLRNFDMNSHFLEFSYEYFVEGLGKNFATISRKVKPFKMKQLWELYWNFAERHPELKNIEELNSKYRQNG